MARYDNLNQSSVFRDSGIEEVDLKHHLLQLMIICTPIFLSKLHFLFYRLPEIRSQDEESYGSTVKTITYACNRYFLLRRVRNPEVKYGHNYLAARPDDFIKFLESLKNLLSEDRYIQALKNIQTIGYVKAEGSTQWGYKFDKPNPTVSCFIILFELAAGAGLTQNSALDVKIQLLKNYLKIPYPLQVKLLTKLRSIGLIIQNEKGLEVSDSGMDIVNLLSEFLKSDINLRVEDSELSEYSADDLERHNVAVRLLNEVIEIIHPEA
jgi:hypothetical protein